MFIDKFQIDKGQNSAANFVCLALPSAQSLLTRRMRFAIAHPNARLRFAYTEAVSCNTALKIL